MTIELSRREFLKSIGVIATAISIPVSIEIATKSFVDLQKAHKNYLILQAPENLVIAEVRAIDLTMIREPGVLRVVFEDTFDVRKLKEFARVSSRLELNVHNGTSMRFEGAGRIMLLYRLQEGNCIEIKLDHFRCTTKPSLKFDRGIDKWIQYA